MKKVTFAISGLVVKAEKEGMKGNIYRLQVTDFAKDSFLEVIADYDKEEFTLVEGDSSLLKGDLQKLSTIEDAKTLTIRNFENGIKTIREIGRGAGRVGRTLIERYAFDIFGEVYHCSIVQDMQDETIRIYIENEYGKDKQAFFDGAEWKTESGFYSGDRKLAIAMLERMSGIEIKEG